jgi:hypothetical protein
MPARTLKLRVSRKSTYACSSSTAFFLQSLDHRVFELQFSDESNPRREGVAEDQDETMEVQCAVGVRGLVEVEVHVARHRPGHRVGAVRRLGSRIRRQPQHGRRDTQKTADPGMHLNQKNCFD